MAVIKDIELWDKDESQGQRLQSGHSLLMGSACKSTLENGQTCRGEGDVLQQELLP